MLYTIKLSRDSVVAPLEMGHVFRQGRSSIQEQTLDAVREQIPLPWTEKGLVFPDKHKVGHSFGVPYLDPTCELRQNGSTEEVVQPKSSENDRKSWLGRKAYNDDEIVKHMSNLPGFLQQVEKVNSIQEKALNFGILDWNRLEKWKYNELMPGTYHKKTSSTISNSSAIGLPKMSPNLQRQPSSHGLSPSSPSSRKQPMPHVSRFSSPQRHPPPSHSSHLNSSKEERNITYDKKEKYVDGIKSKGKETHCQEFQAAQSSTIHRQQDNFVQKVEFYDRNCSKTNLDSRKRKDPKKEVMSEKEASSSEWGKHKLSLPLHDKINAQGKNNETRLDDGVDFTSECCPADQANIFLHGPKHFPKGSCSESSQFTGSRTSVDGQLTEAIGNRYSDCYSPQELCSGEFSPDIPRSCPLPSGAAVHTDSAVEALNLLTSQAIDLGICTNACEGMISVTPLPFEGKCSLVNEKTRRPSFSVEASHNAQEEIAEQPNVKGRPPSPTRRFSFNLGRMSRSFSFKEHSAVPQLSSTHTTVRSGPVRPEVSSVMDNFEREKANASSRGRSSPLRRLLDPLLKHKGAQSAETVRPPNGSLDSLTFRSMDTTGPTKGRKPEASTCQALLQITLKNGLPFFKLVVDNSCNKLAAFVKRLPTSGKSDPGMIYAFSVHEIRTKSMNWINQGLKSKSCSLGYSIVGEMKITTSYHPKVNAAGSSVCVARECVLYGVDPGQVNKQKPEFPPNKEIAAIVVKNSSENLNVGDLSDKNQPYTERECPQCVSDVTLDTEKNNNSNGTIVILPGGLHGTPIKGAPSSLISRWRSGGSCDCGGWDVGCKLRILTDYKKCSNILEASMSSSAIDRVDLFVQGGKSKPVFSLEPFSNGFYSMELDASISLLEAFATSVAYITCRKFSDILDTKDQSDAEHFPEAIVGTDKMKTAATFQGQVPAKYVTCPPLSPVGRI